MRKALKTYASHEGGHPAGDVLYLFISLSVSHVVETLVKT